MLKTVGRYLKGRPRLVWKYEWQAPTSIIDITKDARLAGCRRSHMSTSDGTIMIGTHLIRAYSKNQAVVAKMVVGWTAILAAVLAVTGEMMVLVGVTL